MKPITIILFYLFIILFPHLSIADDCPPDEPQDYCDISPPSDFSSASGSGGGGGGSGGCGNEEEDDDEDDKNPDPRPADHPYVFSS